MKIDPGNVELLTQKQKLLTSAIADTQDKLKALREAEKLVQEQVKKGEASQKQYNALKREIVATEQSEKNLTAQLKETNKALDSQGESMTKSVLKAELLKDVMEKVGKAVLNAAKNAVQYNAKMESFTAAFASFLGSTEEAMKAINNIKKDAASMPFGASELIEANQALITTGETADEARENINALAAAVAATGGGNAELTRMASNLQQIRNTGQATSVDIKQFANAGINIYGLLSDYAAATNQDVNKMKLSYENVTAALRMATQEGGAYYGAMEKQAETYNGQLNTLKSRIQDSLGTTFQSVSDTLKDKVFPAINKALDSIDFKKLGESIGKILDTVSTILPAVTWVVDNVISLLGKVMENINPLFDGVKNLLTDLINFIANVFTGKWKEAWGAVVDFLKDTFAIGINAVITVINTIIDAINKVIEWVTGNADTISKIGYVETSDSSSTKKDLPPLKKGVKGNGEKLMASGGVLSNGSAIVGEAGAELLTMNGGVATLTPINNTTTNLGGINMSIYGAPGQSVNELADVVMSRIQSAVDQKVAVWA